MSPDAPATSTGSDTPVVAAGAVLWRTDGDACEIALVHRPRYDDWSLPKGKLERSETPPETAVREVREETGHSVVLGRPLGVMRYPVVDDRGRVRPKVVHWWAAAREVEHSGVPAVRSAAAEEIDDLRWLPVTEALTALTRAAEADVVRRWVAGPARTTALVVLRHAHAGPRAQWEGPDELRPLSDKGSAQAEAVVPVLDAFGVEVMLSSPSLRCVQTLTPFAAGRTVTTDPALVEDLPAAVPAALRRVLGQVGAGTAVVACTHRQTLPALLASLRPSALVALPPPRLRKAGMHVLHLAGGRVVAAESWRPAGPRTVGTPHHSTPDGNVSPV